MGWGEGSIGMPICGLNERVYVSGWTIMHFLSGYLWNVAWSWATDGWLPWLNLLLLAIVAVAFELLENEKDSGAWMWGWLGYDTKSYAGDTTSNSNSDVLASLIGWGVVQPIVMTTRSDATLGALLGVAGTLFVIFLVLFYFERKEILAGAAVRGTVSEEDAERPPLVFST